MASGRCSSSDESAYQRIHCKVGPFLMHYRERCLYCLFWFGLVRIRPLWPIRTIAEPWDEGDEEWMKDRFEPSPTGGSRGSELELQLFPQIHYRHRTGTTRMRINTSIYHRPLLTRYRQFYRHLHYSTMNRIYHHRHSTGNLEFYTTDYRR